MPPVSSERMIPSNEEMEKSVIGALLIDGNAYSQVGSFLSPEDFFCQEYRLIYELISELSIQGQPVDILTVIDKSNKKGYGEDFSKKILECSSSVITSAHIEYHAMIVHQLAERRRLISIGVSLQVNGFDDCIDIEDLKDSLLSGLKGVYQWKDSNLTQEVAEAYKILHKRESVSSGIAGISSGLESLDEVTAGFQNGDVILVGGRPTMGKTTLLCSMAVNIAVNSNVPAAIFTIEMNNHQMVKRLIANHSKVSQDKINRGLLKTEEWAAIDKNIIALHKAPLFIDDTPSLSVRQLRSKLFYLVKTKGVKIAFIDYLQLLTLDGKPWHDAMDLSVIMREIKIMARELNIPVVVLAQLHRANKYDDTRNLCSEPQIIDFVGCNEVSNYADTTILLHRPEYYHIRVDEYGNDLHNVIMAYIFGTRHCKEVIRLHFEGEYSCISNLKGYSQTSEEIKTNSMDNPFGHTDCPY